MSEKLVGLDIGATAVRAVEVSGTDEHGMPLVTAAGIARTPYGAVSGGRIVEPAMVAEAIKEALGAAKLSRYGVIVGMSSPRVALFTASLPAELRPSEWAGTIRLQNQSRPVSTLVQLQDSVLSTQRLGESDGKTLLAVSAVDREDMARLMAALRMAKVTPRAVDLSAAATFRGLTRIPANDTGSVHTIVDVGASKTTVATRRGLRLRSVSGLDVGGENITRALQGALDVPLEDAEPLKMSLRVGDADAVTPRSSAALALALAYGSEDEETKVAQQPEDTTVLAGRAVTAAADEIVEQVANAIEHDTGDHPDHPTTAVLVCGRSALLHGLRDRLESRLGVHAFVRAPYINVRRTSHTKHLFTSDVVPATTLLELVTATGLATWKDSA